MITYRNILPVLVRFAGHTKSEKDSEKNVLILC